MENTWLAHVQENFWQEGPRKPFQKCLLRPLTTRYLALIRTIASRDQTLNFVLRTTRILHHFVHLSFTYSSTLTKFRICDTGLIRDVSNSRKHPHHNENTYIVASVPIRTHGIPSATSFEMFGLSIRGPMI
jgi:hypothetical protein